MCKTNTHKKTLIGLFRLTVLVRCTRERSVTFPYSKIITITCGEGIICYCSGVEFYFLVKPSSRLMNEGGIFLLISQNILQMPPKNQDPRGKSTVEFSEGSHYTTRGLRPNSSTCRGNTVPCTLMQAREDKRVIEPVTGRF